VIAKNIHELFTKVGKINRRSVIFLACLGLSSVFWLLTTLSESYVEDISIPVSYSDLAENKVLMSRLPTELILEVEATGFELLYLKMNGPNEQVMISASPKNLKRLPSADAGKYVLVTERKLGHLRDELNDGFSLIGIRPDSIIFDFRDKVEKKLPVAFTGTTTFESQFGQVGAVTFNPPTVSVSGPRDILDTLTSVYTTYAELEDLDDNVLMEVELNGGKEGLPLTISPSVVEMKMAVEKYTEGSLTVQLQKVGSAENQKVKLFPSQVQLSYQVPLSQFDLVTLDQFSAHVNLNDIKNVKGNSLDVKIIEYPNSVTRVKADPAKVEFIIQQ